MSVQQKKPIADASPQELRDFAELVLQLSVPSDVQPGDIRAQIATAWPQDFIFVEQAELEPAAESQTDQARAEAQIKIMTGESKDDPKWKIRIGSTEMPGGRDPVPVGCNGVVALIQRDMIAEVPHRYIGVLRDAVRVSVTHIPGSRGEFIYSNVLAYPFEVLDQPSRSEIEECHARTRDKVLA